MITHIYEYLFTAVVIISILVASSLMVDTLSQPARDASVKDQLKITAEKVMTQILLDPGFPREWGTDLDGTVQTFGLAKYGETSREAYMLDPDKVQRLNPNIGAAYFLRPSDALKSLNLGHDYGFTLEINENLNITIQRIPSENEKFLVGVTSYFDQMPITNVKITGAIYASQSGNIVRRGLSDNATVYDGTCQIDFDLPTGSQPEALIIVANYYGARLTRVFPANGQTIQAYMLGDQVIASQEYSLTNGELPHPAKEILAIKSDQDYTITDFAVGNAGTSGKLLLEAGPEPSAVAILASVNNDNAILVASRDLRIVYRSIDFPDPQQRAAAFAYSLERTVLIAGTTYTATLYIWRMAT